MTLIDGCGADPVQNASILTENGLIKEIGDLAADAGEYDQLVDLTADIREAHKFGAVTGAHCFGAQSARYLLEAGIDSIEHGCFLCEDEKLFDMMQACGTYYVPTIRAIEIITNQNREPGGFPRNFYQNQYPPITAM